MRYKLEYCRALVEQGLTQQIFSHFDLRHLTQEEANFLLQIASEPQQTNGTMSRDNLCLALLHINTRQSIRLLRQHYFETLVGSPKLLEHVHHVTDDGLRYDLLRYLEATFPMTLNNIHIRLKALILAMGRMNDKRFVPYLKYLVERNYFDFDELVPDTPRHGMAALQALSLMPSIKVRRYVNQWCMRWHKVIKKELAQTPLYKRDNIIHVPQFAFQQPVLAHHILGSLTRLDMDDPNLDIIPCIRRLIVAHDGLPQQEFIIKQVITYAGKARHHFVRVAIFTTLRHYDDAAVTEFAMRLAAVRPITALLDQCMQTLYHQKFASLKIANLVMSDLKSASLSSRRAIHTVAVSFLRYLTLIDTPEMNQFILDFVRKQSFIIKKDEGFEILALIANRHDATLHYLAESLSNPVEYTQRHAVRALSRCGERGIPLLITLLKQPDLQPEIISELSAPHHDRLIPRILELIPDADDISTQLHYALIRIGSESAYQTLLVIM